MGEKGQGNGRKGNKEWDIMRHLGEKVKRNKRRGWEAGEKVTMSGT